MKTTNRFKGSSKKSNWVKSVAALLMVTSALGSVAPALAQDVRDSQELTLLESMVAASGEKSAQARNQAIERAFAKYLQDSQGRAEHERLKGLADAAELMGIDSRFVDEVTSATRDAVTRGKDLAKDATYKSDLARAFSRMKQAQGAQFKGIEYNKDWNKFWSVMAWAGLISFFFW